jgi:hypothetical protein
MGARGSPFLSLEARRLLKQVLGGSSLRPILFAVFLISSLGWFADSFYGALEDLLKGWFSTEALGLYRLLLALPFVVTLVLLVRQAQHWSDTPLPFRVRAEHPARPAKALILFLSRPKDAELASNDAVRGALQDPTTVQAIEGPWRMNMEALAHHQKYLREVVLIESSGDGGSRAARAKFNALLVRLWPDAKARVRTQGDFDPELDNGADYFDLEKMVRVVDDIVRTLLEEGIADHELIVDITSGPKIVTAAGSAVAIADRRRFQYVDTHTYEVVAFESFWEEEKE